MQTYTLKNEYKPKPYYFLVSPKGLGLQDEPITSWRELVNTSLETELRAPIEADFVDIHPGLRAMSYDDYETALKDFAGEYLNLFCEEAGWRIVQGVK